MAQGFAFRVADLAGECAQSWASDTFSTFPSEVGTKQAVRALWVELARLVLRMLSFRQELNFERMLILGQEVNLERMLIFGQEMNF